MADNPSIPVTAGSLLAADDIGGVYYQRVKVTFGADGSASDVSSSAPLPISAASLPLPSGAATAAGLTAVQTAAEASQPATQAFDITPHATNAITPLPRAVRVNAAGTVTFRMSGSATDVTITALAGEIIPGRVQYIRATGTTAAGFLGLA